jgi:uncharacterized protein YjbI with pentapeptide repeats
MNDDILFFQGEFDAANENNDIDIRNDIDMQTNEPYNYTRNRVFTGRRLIEPMFGEEVSRTSIISLAGFDFTNTVIVDLSGGYNSSSWEALGYNFSGATLSDTRIYGGNIPNSIFQGRLNNVRFDGVRELSGSVFTNVFLTDVVFINCDLLNCHFEEATLNNVTFIGCSLVNSNFEGAILNGNTRFIDSEMDGITGLPDQLPGQEVDIIENRHQHEGVAYEVHNSFASFVDKKDRYLKIIAQPEPDPTIRIDEYINTTFIDKIIGLFPEHEEKLRKFRILLSKSSGTLSALDSPSKSLILKSLSFVFSQDDAFIRHYINIWLSDSFDAYDGPGDTTSCVNGIIERFVLSVMPAALAVCSDDTKCTSQYEALIKLNRIFKINEVAIKWWNDESNRTSSTDFNERRESFIRFLIEKAEEQDFHDEETKERIRQYARRQITDEQYERFELGGRRKRVSGKSKKSRRSKKSRMSKKKSRRFKKSHKLKRLGRSKKYKRGY